MVNAVRSRGGTGSRAPGLIDPGAVKATTFHFNNTASIEFGGTNEYIVGPSMDSIATFTKEFSISMWFKWEASAPVAFRFLAEANTTASTLSDGWGLFWSNTTQLRFFLINWNQGDKYAISNVISDIGTEWHHVVGVYDGNQTLDTDTVKIYVDGVVGSNTGQMVLDMNALDKNVEIGRGGNAGSNDTHYMRGHGDEFALWDVPLSADAVTSIYNEGVPFDLTADLGDYTSSGDLKLHWRLGEEDTNTTDGIHDASGNGHTATMTNMEDADIDSTTFAGI